MGTKQVGVLGLFLALFFGARTANRPGAVHSGPAPIKVESNHSAKEKNPGSSANSAFPQNANDCRDTVAIARFRKLHWWLLQQSSQGCPLSLSPVWKEICKINPEHRNDEDFQDPNLTGQQFIAHCLGESHPISSMMAAVPNPRRTHLGLMTDRAIETIQVAASEAHFLLLSHYLPWPSPSVGATGPNAVSESENQSNSADPGVLIFRDVDHTPEPQSQHQVDPSAKHRPMYLLVFLIPEVPTEGLDRQVFSNAETMIEKVSPDINAIRFVGPNFSGSVASLMELANEDPGKRFGAAKCIHAVSGSVTNAKAYPKTKESCSTFDVVETGDSEAICEFVIGARAFGYESNQIAILSEEGTQYGRQGAENDGDGDTQNGRTINPCTKPGKEDERAGLWFLHFPREISKLRNAYGAVTGKLTSTDSTAQTGLGLQWQDAEAAQRDDLQTYGDRQTPLSQETVLSTLSITLRAQGIKALGVLATDPMDEAFLIHSIRESSPDVRLFLRDPDLLFLRTPDVGSLNGTLLLSNYPLIPQNQFWSSTKNQSNQKDQKHQEERRLLTFPSAFQEGEYNAMIELIEDAGLAPSDTKMKRLEWNWPTGASGAQGASDSDKERPLWLATIGTAGHYPIKILNYKSAKKAGLKLHSLELGPPQFLPMAFWCLIAMLGLLHVLGLKFRGAMPSYFKQDFDLSDKTSTVTLVKISCHAMAMFTITLVQFILGSSYLFFYDSGWRYTLLACSVACVTAFLIWAVSRQVYALYVLHRQQEQRAVPDEHRMIISPASVFWSSVLSIAIMVGAGSFWGGITNQTRFDNAFLHFRDLNLSSGVAPALPLSSVLMVLYFGVWTYLRRLSYWEHRYVEMYNLKLDLVVRRDLSVDVRAIDRCLLGPLENGKWMAGFFLMLGACILAFRPWVTLDMIEPSKVWLFVLFFFGLALLTLWLNWFRCINIWVHLRTILEHLENLPIRAAFQRLPPGKSMPILQWSSSQNIFLLRQVLDRLRALARADTSAENIALQTQFESRIDALMSEGVIKIKIVERRVVGGSPRSNPETPVPSRRREDCLRDAREEMTKLTAILSARLLGEYWRRGSSSTKDQEPQPADLKCLLAEDIVALPFYAYIRKVMNELRNILFFLGLGISLLFAALHTYAFRADQAIDWWFFGLFAFMGGGIVVVIAQMEQNALLSRLSDRTPGELGTGFYLQLLKYGTVPFLTIFGSQVPSISNLVLKWVQPALEALH